MTDDEYITIPLTQVATMKCLTPERLQELLDKENRLVAAEDELHIVREALLDQIGFWESVPCGPDYEAQEDDQSPQDMTSHLAGLAIRAAKKALESRP